MPIRYLSGLSVDSTVLVVDAANDRVGIGTASPTTKLQLYGSGLIDLNVTSTDNQAILYLQGTFGQVQSNVGDFYITNSAPSSPMIFRTATTERMRITSAGNVGIGTTAPSQKLAVQGEIAKYTTTGIDGTYDNFIKYGYFADLQSGSTTTNRFHAIDGTLTAGGASSNVLAFKVYQGNAAQDQPPLTVMSLLGNGNVGIGTTAPGQKLQIDSPLRTEFYGTDSASPADAMNIVGTGASRALGTGSALLFSVPANTDGTNIWAQARILGTGDNATNGSAEGAMFLQTRALYNPGVGGSWNWRTNMVLRASGNVGIGTTSPAYKLDVDGGPIRITNGFSEPTSEAGYRLKFADNGGINNDSGIGLSGSLGDESLWINKGSANGNIRFMFGTLGEKVTFTSGGNVGIGTTSPNTKLQVSALNSNYVNLTGGFSVVKAEEGYGMYMGVASSGNSWIQSATYDNGITYPLILNSAGGNVGIGTTAPNAKLQVAGDIASTFGSTNGYVSLQAGNTIVQGYVEWFKPGPTRVAYMGYNDGSTANNLAITLENSANFIVNNGNVGIGTASPAFPLTVYHATNSAATFQTSGTGTGAGNGFYVGHASNISYVWNYNNFPLVLATNNTERVRVTEGGNVGIGTSSPQARLQVSSSTSDGLIVSTSANAEPFIALWRNSGSNGVGVLRLIDGGNIYFDNGATGAAQSTKMVLTAGGNVGIGTTAPTNIFNIYKKINATVASNSQIVIGGDQNVVNDRYLGIGINQTASYGVIDAVNAGIGGIPIVLQPSGGNVLIGTTTDAGQKLQVSGQSSLKLGSGTTQQTIVTFDNATNSAYLSVVGIGTTSVVGTWTNGSMVLEAVPFSTGSFILGAYTGSTIIQNGRVNRVEVSSAGAVKFNNYGSGTFTGTPTFNLAVDASGNIIETAGGVVDGSGTANYVTKWQDANTVTNSVLYDDGTNVGIGTTSPGAPLHVYKSDTYSAIISRADWNSGTSTKLALGKQYGVLGFISSDLVETTNDTSYIALNYKSGIATYAEGLRVYNNGNVGIGTTSPANTLDIAAAQATLKLQSTTGTNTVFARLENTAGTFYIGRDNSAGSSFGFANAAILYESGANPMVFVTNSAEHMRITSAGNVGIGTTSPAYKLHVQGSNLMATFRNSSTGADQYTQLEFIAGSRDAYIWLGNQNTTAWAGDGGLNIYTGTGNMDFWTAATQKMRLTASGNLGIGTTAPSAGAKLHVEGNIFSNNVGGNAFSINSTGANYGFILNNSANTFSLGYGTSLGTLGTSVLTWNSSGNVGIGTTAPNAQLDVYTTQGGSTIAATHGTGGTYPKASGISFGATSTSLSVSNNGGTVVFTGGAGIYANNTAASNNPTELIFWTTSAGTPASRLTIASTGAATFGSSVEATSFIKTSGTAAQYLMADGSVSTLTNPVTGTGTTNYVPKFTSASAIGDSAIYDNGGNIGIGTTAPLQTSANRVVTTINGTTSAILNLGIGGTLASYYYASSSGSTLESIGTNTISASGANIIQLTTNGSERMRITDAGNVGIGTTSPSSLLNVVASGSAPAALTVQDNARKVKIGRDQIEVTDLSDVVSTMYLQPNANLVINSSAGNVGIGVQPTEKLHVDGSTLITYNNSFQSTNSVGNKAILARVSPTSGIINYAEYATATNLNGFVIGSDDARVKGNITGDSLEFITNTSTRMTILSSGNVGINTTTPGSTLHVIGDVLIQTGALGVGVNPNATDGRIDASNDIVAFSTSDKRLKENITPIANALEKVRSLTGVEFDWKEETKSVHGYEGHDVGVIAQDVQAVLPEAVRTNDSGYLSVRYEKMIALLVEANKELANRVEQLEKLIK